MIWCVRSGNSRSIDSPFGSASFSRWPRREESARRRGAPNHPTRRTVSLPLSAPGDEQILRSSSPTPRRPPPLSVYICAHLQIPHPPSSSLLLVPILLEFLSSARCFLAKISDLGNLRERWRECLLVFSSLFVCMGLDVGEIGRPLDLGLDLKLFVARSASRMAAAKEAPEVDACIRGLEEEQRKIEMFRRELPLCVRLLADVIEVMKEEAEKGKGVGDAEAKAEDNDKMKWMSTAQLWVDSRGSDADSVEEQVNESTLSKPTLRGGASVPLMAIGCGALPPTPPSQYFMREDKVVSTEGLHGLPMMSSAVKRPFSPVTVGDDRRHALTAKFAATMPPAGLGLNLQTQEQQARKTRRCWSPELHRQFVAALRQLGGPQVATPKQIREVMKVDGLTNDEVKSHLQKYRLHNQRSPGTASPSHPIVLVGDIWVHQEQSSSQSGSPQGPLQFSGSRVAVSTATGSDSSSEGDDKSEGYNRK